MTKITVSGRLNCWWNWTIKHGVSCLIKWFVFKRPWVILWEYEINVNRMWTHCLYYDDEHEWSIPSMQLSAEWSWMSCASDIYSVEIEQMQKRTRWTQIPFSSVLVWGPDQQLPNQISFQIRHLLSRIIKHSSPAAPVSDKRCNNEIWLLPFLSFYYICKLSKKRLLETIKGLVFSLICIYINLLAKNVELGDI